MPRLVALLFSLLFMFTPLRAEDLSADDTSALQQVIESQLNAFAADRGEEAYGFAAPIVKFAFPDAATFMRMVQQGYEPVYRNNGHEFGELTTDQTGRPAQKVLLMGRDGKNYEAVYFMEKQADGSWKISGCVVTTLQDINA